MNQPMKRSLIVLLPCLLCATAHFAGAAEARFTDRFDVDGQMAEVSRNYFAISRRTTDGFDFGEDVDVYRGGKVTSHEGAWLSGVAGARFGLLMPGTPWLGARYQPEVAPKVAPDRAEVVSLTETLATPAGKFERCLKTEETSGMERGKAHKLCAPGIGLVCDGDLKLTKWSYAAQ
jgi:hypothetical protein